MSDPTPLDLLREVVEYARWRAEVGDFAPIDLRNPLERMLHHSSLCMEPAEIAQAYLKAARVPGDEQEFRDSFLDFLSDLY